MKNIILLPLDERPCNFDFPSKIFNGEKYTILRPARLGQKKTPADYAEIRDFLLSNIEKADAAVLSIDTLLYGGLIPSRLHTLGEDEALERLMLLKTLREKNPSVKLYAFHCIMRCPTYSSDDEEPDYYADYGAEIHQLGRLTHLEKLGMGDAQDCAAMREKIDADALADYLNRRAFNRRMNVRTLDLVEDGTIDFLIIPQDDSAKYGYTAMDQQAVRAVIDEKVLNDRVILYPGADELGMTLTARAVNALEGDTPRVYLKYASTLAPQLIPNYEDRSLNETVKYHVMAAGCVVVPSLRDADFVMGITAPANKMLESAEQPANNMDYDVERNMAEFLYFVNDCIRRGIPVAILDNAYTNGGELQLLRVLNKQGNLMKLLGYAGWNTSANSMGTVLAQAVNGMHQKNRAAAMDFLVERYIEDCGYGAVVRAHVTEHILPQWGMTYFRCDGQNGKAAQAVFEALQAFIEKELTSLAGRVILESVVLPWSRMFEIGVTAKYR